MLHAREPHINWSQRITNTLITNFHLKRNHSQVRISSLYLKFNAYNELVPNHFIISGFHYIFDILLSFSVGRLLWKYFLHFTRDILLLVRAKSHPYSAIESQKTSHCILRDIIFIEMTCALMHFLSSSTDLSSFPPGHSHSIPERKCNDNYLCSLPLETRNNTTSVHDRRIMKYISNLQAIE